jgi:hypothetical protein
LVLPDATHFQTANRRIMLNPYASQRSISSLSFGVCTTMVASLLSEKAREHRERQNINGYGEREKQDQSWLGKQDPRVGVKVFQLGAQ